MFNKHTPPPNTSDLEVGKWAYALAFSKKNEISSTASTENSESDREEDLESGSQLNKVVSNTAEEILQITAEREETIAKLEKRQFVWKVIRNVGGVASCGIFLIPLLLESTTEIIDEDSEASKYVRIAALISTGVLEFGALAMTGIFHRIYRHSVTKQEEVLALTEEDKQAVIRLKLILNNIGKLIRAKEEKDPDIDVEASAKACFKTIKKLPAEISKKSLPEKEEWAWFITELLPDTHPIKQKIKNISNLTKEESMPPKRKQKQSDSTSSDGEHFFKNVGQSMGQRTFAYSQLVQKPINIESEWKQLCEKMGGLHIKYIKTDDGVLKNPNLKNPFSQEQI